MSYIEESLSTGETVLETFGQHWTSWTPFFLCLLVAPITLGLSLLVAIYLFLKLRSTEQGLTNRRVILKTGFISRHSEEMRLGSIETVEIRQSVSGRLFGFGRVEITGRGASDLIFARVSDPIAVKRAIESASNAVERNS